MAIGGSIGVSSSPPVHVDDLVQVQNPFCAIHCHRCSSTPKR